MVFATVEIMLPGPVILEGHELVNIHGFTVDEPFIFHIDALGEVMSLWALVANITTRHRFSSLVGLMVG
tara:strand:+ start:411 stop:617 length:207 start_codon:yes stop_codon:yes gene_type:complete